MQRTGLLLIFIFVWISTHAHDLRMGMFEVYVSEGEYKMDIRFDKEELLKCIQINFHEYAHKSSDEDLVNYISEYLDSNLGLIINDFCVSPSVEKLEFTKDFIHITTSLNYVSSRVDTIKVFNACLLDTSNKHTNIMKFALNDRIRSFKLDADRTSTLVSY